LFRLNDPVVPQIIAYARNSAVATIAWKDRGTAPIGYVNGMAVAFARVYTKLCRNDSAAMDMAQADTGNDATDAIAHFAREFSKLGMDNSDGGTLVLRHLFVLLYGLGMRESSGMYFAGSGGNTAATTAEAGLFQVSYNSHSTSPELDKLFRYYKGRTDFIEIFREGAHAKNAADLAANLQDWGNGVGAEFQELTKDCPAFAVEYAAVLLRHNRQYSGPLNLKNVELRTECDEMFTKVQALIDNNSRRFMGGPPIRI
jgi:hypothetical protein